MLVALIGVGNPGDSLIPGHEAVQRRIGTELVEQTDPAHSKSSDGGIDNLANLLMAPGAVNRVWADSQLMGGPFLPGPPAPPAGGRAFSWLFASAIGAAFVTFTIIAVTASSGD
jgi:hypothetical protein